MKPASEKEISTSCFKWKSAFKSRKAENLLISETSPRWLVKVGRSFKMYVSRKTSWWQNLNNVHPTVPIQAPTHPCCQWEDLLRLPAFHWWLGKQQMRWSVLNLSCKLHPGPGLRPGWVIFGLPVFLCVFLFDALCMRRAVLSGSFFSNPAFVSPQHTHTLTQEDLFPRETSVCHNPCCLQSLIGWPTDLP